MRAGLLSSTHPILCPLTSRRVAKNPVGAVALQAQSFPLDCLVRFAHFMQAMRSAKTGQQKPDRQQQTQQVGKLQELYYRHFDPLNRYLDGQWMAVNGAAAHKRRD